MNKFSKILSISILLSSGLFAASRDENIISFEQKRITQNPNVKIKDIKISTKKTVKTQGHIFQSFVISPNQQKTLQLY